MKHLLRVQLFLSIVLLSMNIAKASNHLGAEIYWKNLANDSFEITIIQYRSCSSGAVTPITPGITSDSSSTSYSVSAGNYISWDIENITQTCDTNTICVLKHT